MTRMETTLRVRRFVMQAFTDGRLGLLAATENIPEGKLREFAEGDINALTTAQIAKIAWRIGAGA